MNNFFRILYESFRQATQQLFANRLRSLLSILGITIGIFCIVAVQSAVNSLQTDIKGTFSAMGSNVLYVDIFPWDGSVNEDNFRKYLKRPEPDFIDLQAIKSKAPSADKASLAFFTGGKTIKYRSEYVQGSFIMGVTQDYPDIVNLRLQEGRFFSAKEWSSGDDKVILGHQVAEALFKQIEPIGKYVKFLGRKYQVVGVLQKEGKSLFSMIPYDEAVIISTENMQKSYVLNQKTRMGRLFNVLPHEGVDLDQLKEEVTGVLRSTRRLKPAQDNNFALNEQSMINDAIDGLFATIRLGGFFIALFALLVGMFGVANIMFVSVNERTKIIGIKKAIGAKPSVILTEFLLEAMLLSIFGGLIGILFTVGVMSAINAFDAIPFKFFVSPMMALLGVLIAAIVGLLAGMIPAWIASRKDPVVAIRK